MIRSTLSIISLALLGLYTRNLADVDCIVNGDLYLRWSEIFTTKAPPVRISISKDDLRRIQKAFRGELLLTKCVLAMCLKLLKNNSNPRFEIAFNYLVATHESGAPLLEELFDMASARTGLKEVDLLSYLTVEKTLLSWSECHLIRNQYEHFFLVMRYVAYCYNHKKTFDNGVEIRTRFYRYAPLIDKRFLASITTGSYELKSFFVGFPGGPTKCAQPYRAHLNGLYVEAGRVCRILIECPEFDEEERRRKRLQEHQAEEAELENICECVECCLTCISFF